MNTNVSFLFQFFIIFRNDLNITIQHLLQHLLQHMDQEQIKNNIIQDIKDDIIQQIKDDDIIKQIKDDIIKQIKGDSIIRQIKNDMIQQTKNDMITYINLSKEVIDEYLDRRDYRKALGRLLMTLDKLDEEGKQDMLSYYINNMNRFDILRI